VTNALRSRALKTGCFPANQLFSSRAQARREIFEYIELYYNNQRLHGALEYRTPCQYETQFESVIDIETNQAQGLDAATEDRALLRTQLERRCSLANGRRGRLRAAHRPKGRHPPEQVQSEKSQGLRDLPLKVQSWTFLNRFDSQPSRFDVSLFHSSNIIKGIVKMTG